MSSSRAGKMDLPQGALIDVGADRHPLELLVVAGKVLDTTPDSVSLHAPYIGNGETTGEKWVLGVRLEGPTGQRSPRDTYGGAEK